MSESSLTDAASSEPNAAEQQGSKKKIILFSDGTGNAGGKKSGTNVWRTYTSLDMGQTDQVAIHDDGVGTQDQTILKAVGGAFGWGLTKNVKQLYEFLCRSYEPGDHIYLFGFSRGAYTVRVLAGLICRYGLLNTAHNDYNTPGKLKTGVDEAYKDYRRSYRTLLGRILFKNDGENRSDVLSTDNSKPILCPEIAFIGVWDTVDAVGLPFDALADAIDATLYKFRFTNQDLNLKKVKRACHAISIDDERKTFHPVLWNEDAATKGIIEQVWFAGVHSNVGGSYPKDQLSYVPLNWMMDKASDSRLGGGGLRFIAAERDKYAAQQSVDGRMYDSRSGFAAYYRYRPRDIDAICGNAGAPRRVHESVFDRIASGATGYAPLLIPKDLAIIGYDGAETDHNFKYLNREAVECLIKNRVNLYRAFLVASATALMIPVFFSSTGDGACIENPLCLLTPLIDIARALTPDFLDRWLLWYRSNPIPFAIAITIFAFMAWSRGRLADSLQNASTRDWRNIFN